MMHHLPPSNGLWCTIVPKLPCGHAADATLQLNSHTSPAAKIDPDKAGAERPRLNSLDRSDSISRAGLIAVSARQRFDSYDSNWKSLGRSDTQDLLESDDSSSSHSRFGDPDVEKTKGNTSVTNMENTEEILRREGSIESEEIVSRLSSGASDIGVLRRRSSEGSSGGRAAGKQQLVPLTPIQDAIDEELSLVHGIMSPLHSPALDHGFRGRCRFNSIQEDELHIEEVLLEGGAEAGQAGGAEAA
jgi:hypothetical protein